MVEQIITQEGFNELKKELEYLKVEKTREIAALIKHTASFGDLKENAAYHDAKDKQAFLQGDIKQLEQRIRNSRVVQIKHSGKVELGTKVTLLMDGDEEVMEIVSPAQSDPTKGKMSYESPLGKAILNKVVGQEFEVKVNGNTFKCKILKVE
ncbi:transcription elongation factor GreA [Patescibacteria group bacterium]|nr:transcription elongation factor GreA [Patescibacteria group bacterium]